MISVLVVDDEPSKRARISDAVRAGGAVSVREAATVADAMAAMAGQIFDLVVIDLHLPMRAGEQPTRNAGMRILEVLEPPTIKVKLPRHVVGLTSYDDLWREQQKAFAAQMWQLIRYDRASSDWERIITQKVVRLVVENREPPTYGKDLVIVTALYEVELEHVLMLPCGWAKRTYDNDAGLYFEGELPTPSGAMSVVAAAVGDMGMPAAASFASRMINTFRPRYLAMTGIVAGVKTSFAFGDMLVASEAFDYGAGKHLATKKKGRRVAAKKSRFLPAPAHKEMGAHVKAMWQCLAMNKKAVGERTLRAWGELGGAPGPAAMRKPPSLRIGPVASGASVVADRAIIESIARRNRKVIGVEMEVYGVYYAAATAPEPRPQVFAVKSVCDFGGPEKDDAYQGYAAFTSAWALYELCQTLQ